MPNPNLKYELQQQQAEVDRQEAGARVEIAKAHQNLTAYATDADVAVVAASLVSHTGNTSNPHAVTKTQVGLGNVDNTSDANKPVSTAQATADTAVQTAAASDATTKASAAQSAAIAAAATDATTKANAAQAAAIAAAATDATTKANAAQAAAIAAAATDATTKANAAQAAAVQRANHTGTQLAATISDFDTAVRAAAPSLGLVVALMQNAPSY